MEKDKNNIDDLFKRGLQNTNDSFQEAHWGLMEKRLDSDLSKRKVRWLPYIYGAAVAAAIALLILVYPALLHWNEKPVKTVLTNRQLPSPSSKENSDKLVEAEISGRKPIPTVKYPGPAAPDKKEAQTFVSGEKRVPDPDKLPLLSLQSISPHELAPERTSLQTPEIVGSSTSAVTTIKGSDSPAASDRKDRAAIGSGRTGGTLSILAAPDLTSVSGAGSPSLSQNIGLLYTHPISKRVSISIGAVYARKNYRSPYSFYRPKYPPASSQLPDKVDANCDVIDVPLVINYNLLQLKNGVKLNVSTGMSSYFMLRERYAFEYSGEENYYNQPYGAYEVKGENKHLMGIADFSISAEKKISEKVSIGVRPFMKVPLTGIGYGRTKLESKGVAVTLGLDL